MLLRNIGRRKGRITADVPVRLARPRDVVSAPFNEMRRELARLLDHQ
jgi:hypothetical protein